MSVKFTKCGVGAESGDESLLFEFLDHELPEMIEYVWRSELVSNDFIGSLQTNQHNGIFLEIKPFDFEFVGHLLSHEGRYILAKERFDQLSRIQGRAIKFWFDGIKQIVIIKEISLKIHNYNHIKGTISLKPHDLQTPIKPSKVVEFKQKSFLFSETDATPKTTETNASAKDAGADLQLHFDTPEKRLNEKERLVNQLNKDLKLFNEIANDNNVVDKKAQIELIKQARKQVNLDLEAINSFNKMINQYDKKHTNTTYSVIKGARLTQ